MPKYIHNKSDVEKTYLGSVVAPSSFLLITPEKDPAFAQDNDLCLDLATTSVCMSADGVTDYEGNYSDQINFLKDTKQKFSLDTEYAQLVRIKAAPAGWVFQARGFEIQTSKKDSVVNQDRFGVDIGDVSICFYERVGGVYQEIASSASQLYLDLNCEKTCIKFEPIYDYEIIGGWAACLTAPVNPVRVHVVAVPDIPEGSGGSKVMMRNINMQYISGKDKVAMDGRASKRMNYSATYHTNKLEISILHNIGEKHNFEIVVEHYRL